MAGRKILVTAGPTHEPIDPVRYLANHSSGKQGYAIAVALAARGGNVVLVSGPTELPDPRGVTVIRVETAHDMLAACEDVLPVDVAVMTAAVADWRPGETSAAKLKKSSPARAHQAAPAHIELIENPDILATLAAKGKRRPELLIGFAAETDNIVQYGRDKLTRKKCDWIVANNVSPENKVMGGEHNKVHIITEAGTENWPRMSKSDVAIKLAAAIGAKLTENTEASA